MTHQTTRTALVALSATLAVSAACGGRTDATAAAEVTTRWSQAINSEDAAAVANLYADDARLLPPEGPALEGRREIESYWRDDISDGGTTTTLTREAAFILDEALHVQGTYVVAAADGAELAAGEYAQLWTRSGADWRVQHEMWRLRPVAVRGHEVADRLTTRWTTAYNATDPKALIALYSDDAVLSTPRGGSLSGRDAILAFWTADFDEGAPSTTLTLRDAYVAGTMAHLAGEFLVVDKGVETVGQYVQLWVRDAGEWHIHREMWW
jgi:uncharacterized protein (TIGR02246 family)